MNVSEMRQVFTSFDSHSALLWTNMGSFVFVSQKNVDKDEGTSERVSLTVKELQPSAVAETFSQALSFDTNFLPDGVVRAGIRRNIPWFVQFRKPGMATFKVLAENGTKDVTAPMPGLVMVAFGSARYVFAVKQTKFDENAISYVAPLPNITPTSGSVCWGMNEKIDPELENTKQIWDMFWASPFTGNEVSGHCVSHPKDVRKLLLALAKSGEKKFPVKELVETPPLNNYRPTKTTVKQHVERIIVDRK